jgi:hypothetical protein
MSPIGWISGRAPSPVVAALRPIYKHIQGLINRVKFLGDYLRIIGPDQIYKEDYYSKRRNDPWRSDARIISANLDEYFSPDSVIDFGCAIGGHLEIFYRKGVEIKGVEGNSDAFSHAVVPHEYLEKYDLRNQYISSRSYDLAICFELAEHIPKKYADNLVETLTSASETVVMTAATPGQGGTHHVNEQPREYWYKKFRSRGYSYNQKAVEDLRDQIEVEQSDWIGDNLMVFSANGDPNQRT